MSKNSDKNVEIFKRDRNSKENLGIFIVYNFI